jgi:ABC-type sugar transport system permease subunit/ABC-type glycerol-3-phosphate transport system substrate-binding protein
MRSGVALLLAIGMLLALASAGAEAKETVVFWFGASQDERAAYEAMVEEFNSLHPHIEVKPMLVPQKYIERKLLLSVAGGVPPDVVRFYAHLGGEMMSRGALEPLDELAARDGLDMSDFYPVGIEQNSYDGRLYGIPWVLSPNALFYNKRLFSEAGLDPNRPPSTWQELEDYALRLTVRGQGGRIERVGFANFLNNPTDFHLYLWQSGGRPLSDDLKSAEFAGPEGVEALTWMRDFLIREVGPTDPNMSVQKASEEAVKALQVFQSSYVGATQDPFGLEKVAMRIDSPFRIPDLARYFPDLDYGIAPIPYNRTRAIEVVGNSLVIPKGSKQKEAAWEFVKFASNKEQMLRVCAVAGRIPARRSAATAPEYYENPVVQPFVDQIEFGRTTPVAPGYRQVSDVLARAIEQTLKGQATPEAALADAAAKAREVLAEANEDVTALAEIPWGLAGVAAGLVLVLGAGGGWWYVMRQTRGSRVARREAIQFYLFLSPWLIGFVVFTFGAIAASLLFSFTRWDVITPARFVGTQNFVELIREDPLFIKALYNTLYYAFFSIPLAMIGGLAISVLMNQKLRVIKLFRTIYYLPAIVSGVATAILWQWIFHPQTGLFNRVLTMITVPSIDLNLSWPINIALSWQPLLLNPPGWLIDPVWSKPAFIIMGLWGIGGAMIIYLAGLQGIPEELYEAAKIDGAGTWQRFMSVTLPMLTPAIFYQLVIGTMAAFQFFTPAYIMTNGGPQDSTLFYSLYLFRNAFEWMRMGYASAMAWILFAIVLAITMLQFKSAKRWVYYEGKKEE